MEPLPDSMAGLQLVVNGVVEEGDVFVDGGVPVEYADDFIGVPVDVLAPVYRLIPIPVQTR